MLTVQRRQVEKNREVGKKRGLEERRKQEEWDGTQKVEGRMDDEAVVAEAEAEEGSLLRLALARMLGCTRAHRERGRDWKRLLPLLFI